MRLARDEMRREMRLARDEMRRERDDMRAGCHEAGPGCPHGVSHGASGAGASHLPYYGCAGWAIYCEVAYRPPLFDLLGHWLGTAPLRMVPVESTCDWRERRLLPRRGRDIGRQCRPGATVQTGRRERSRGRESRRREGAALQSRERGSQATRPAGAVERSSRVVLLRLLY